MRVEPKPTVIDFPTVPGLNQNELRGHKRAVPTRPRYNIGFPRHRAREINALDPLTARNPGRKAYNLAKEKGARFPGDLARVHSSFFEPPPRGDCPACLEAILPITVGDDDDLAISNFVSSRSRTRSTKV